MLCWLYDSLQLLDVSLTTPGSTAAHSALGLRFLACFYKRFLAPLLLMLRSFYDLLRFFLTFNV